jgi:peptide/nickel transport system permease protein
MDYPLVLALLLLMILLVAFSNLLADILYMVVDPRISYEARGKAG